jgi:hypothetical protein
MEWDNRRGRHTPNEVIHFASGITAIILESRKWGMMFTFINTADYEAVSQYRWCAWREPKGKTFYVLTNTEGGGHIRLHRLLTGFQFDEVDHIDGNGLNNSRANLRDAQGQNKQNVGFRANNTSGYKGVKKNKDKWEVNIRSAGDKVYLGVFTNKREAREAYDFACITLHGDFARPNQEGV